MIVMFFRIERTGPPRADGGHRAVTVGPARSDHRVPAPVNLKHPTRMLTTESRVPAHHVRAESEPSPSGTLAGWHSESRANLTLSRLSPAAARAA